MPLPSLTPAATADGLLFALWAALVLYFVRRFFRYRLLHSLVLAAAATGWAAVALANIILPNASLSVVLRVIGIAAGVVAVVLAIQADTAGR